MVRYNSASSLLGWHRDNIFDSASGCLYPKKSFCFRVMDIYELESNVKPFDKPNKLQNIIVLCTFLRVLYICSQCIGLLIIF